MKKLSQLLKENKYNRIETNKIKALVEKLLPMLSEDKQKELDKLFVEILEHVFKVNSMPYGIFTSESVETQLIEVTDKLLELKEFLSEDIDVNEETAQLLNVTIKALDEIFEY